MQRYYLERVKYTDDSAMTGVEYGDYVLYSDHLAEIAKMGNDIEHLRQTMYALEKNVIGRDAEIAALQSEANKNMTEIYELRKEVGKHHSRYCKEYQRNIELHQLIKQQEARIKELEASRDFWKNQHGELIMEVSKKFPNESRHETALRYIRERENSSCDDIAKKALTGATQEGE